MACYNPLNIPDIKTEQKFTAEEDDIFMYQTIVAKFGGSSLADASKIKETASIIMSNPARRYVVMSSPGERTDDDIKITDMLYMCHLRFTNRENYQDMLNMIHKRFDEIVSGLGIDFNVDAEIKDIQKSLMLGKSSDYVASRGEFITSKIAAKLLGWEFVDSSEMIFFNNDGTLNELKTFATTSRILKPLEHAVIPGFYGIMPNGSIKTFTRGGSDTTASIIARAVNADLYEKWTDEAEIFCADPKIVKSPKTVENITYKELHELSYMGFTVLNEDSVFPINKSGIPVNIRDVNDINDNGTLILPELNERVQRKNTFVCVAGKRGFRVLVIEKFKMNRATQFAAKLFNIFSRYNIACEHCLTGIDVVSLVLKNPLFDLRREEIISEIKRELNPEKVEVRTNMSLISVIGEGMGTVKGVFAKVFNALANEEVKVKMIDQGSDDLNIILGVDDEDYERSIKALYNALILQNA